MFMGTLSLLTSTQTGAVLSSHALLLVFRGYGMSWHTPQQGMEHFQEMSLVLVAALGCFWEERAARAPGSIQIAKRIIKQAAGSGVRVYVCLYCSIGIAVDCITPTCDFLSSSCAVALASTVPDA